MKKIYLSLIAIVFAINFSYAQWTGSPGDIYYNTGNVSIGTTSFLQKFTIKSTGTQTGGSSTDYDFGITDGATNQLQLLGLVNTTGNYGLLQVIRGGVGAGNLVIQTQGGNVGIGTTTPDAKLAINGTIHAKEVKVDMNILPDYVFKPGYDLLTLDEVQKYIDKNQHLPGVPSAEQTEKEGLKLGEMNAVLLKKVEELTLYLLEKDKQDKQKQVQIDQLKQQVEILIKKFVNDSSYQSYHI